MPKPSSNSPDSVHPAPLDTAADRDGKTLQVDPADKKRQLELQGELEHSDGPERVAIQREVEANEAKRGSGKDVSTRKSE